MFLKKEYLTNKITNICIFLIVNLIHLINLSKIEEVLLAIKEIEYSYYMRGKNIQYSSYKENYFSPEEATSQNINYLVCDGFTKTVYLELLNITIPQSTIRLLSYSRDNIGSPEVVAYSHINKDNNVEMIFYSPNTSINYTKIINPSINDIIPLLEIGDILTYTGHTFLVYDLIKNNEGAIIDAIIMESEYGIGKAYVNSKISERVLLPNGNTFGAKQNYFFLNNKKNSNFEEGVEQGSLGIRKLSTYSVWKNLNNTNLRKDEYSVLRFIQKDLNGNAVLKYKTIYPYLPNNILNGEQIKLSNKNIDRIQFKHLYIEKIVNKINDNVVQLGNILTYRIIIRNAGKNNYNKDLIIIENLSPYVTYETYYINKMDLHFEYDIKNKHLKWNIGKLSKNEEIIIQYLVKVSKGKSGDMIISTGLVGNIPSSIIKNVIGNNLDENKMNLIKNKFEELKNKYNGKKLINEIYKEAFNVDIKFDEFDITKLILNTQLDSNEYKTIYLNTNSTFYGIVLNKYWSTLSTVKYAYIKEGPQVNIYNLKIFRPYTNSERRQDFIYSKTLRTGDILIYINNNDVIYSIDSNQNLIKNYITYEDGEYSYIYIDGKGFVGVNLGKDGKPNTKDDRNEFNSKYYTDNNLELFINPNAPNKEVLEIGNIQTLFGKDYYVILRPSLFFDFKTKSTTLHIILIVLLFVIVSIVIVFVIFYIRKRKNLEKDINNNSLTEELKI